MPVAYDLETDRLEAYKGPAVVAFAVHGADGSNWAEDLRPLQPEARAERLRMMVRALERNPATWAHHGKFDYQHLAAAGADPVRMRHRCTMALAAYLDPNRASFKLGELAYEVGETKPEISAEAMVTTGAIHEASSEQLLNRAAVDARICLKLAERYESQLSQEQRQGWALECDVLPVLARLELRGVPVDIERAKVGRSEVSRLALQELAQAKIKSGYPALYPNSPGTVISHMGIKRAGDWWVDRQGTKLLHVAFSESPPTGREALERSKMPAAAHILAFRELDDLRQFFTNHILSNAYNSRLYPSINQLKVDEAGTRTGRLSYTSPALQQMPARGKLAHLIRACFIAKMIGCDYAEWACADLRQFEFRTFAHCSRAKVLIDALCQDPTLDFHGLVASLMGIPRKMPPGGGANAKQINLGMLFGMGEGKLAYMLKLPVEIKVDENRAKRARFIAGPAIRQVLGRYHAAIPGVQEAIDGFREFAEENGYVTTVFGRRIPIPNPKMAYKAAGLVYQGTAADLNKWLLWRLDGMLDERLLLNVHDEFNFALDGTESDRVRLRESLETAAAEIHGRYLDVPLAWDINHGPTWGDASLE